MEIIKVGGSISKEVSELIKGLKSIEDDFLLIPGGWKFANLVRKIDKEVGLKSEVSHWMAIACMDVYAYFISNFGVNAVLPKNFEELKNLRGINVVLPHFLLRNDVEFYSIPASWDVTADSISIWFAGQLGVKRVIKVTDVDGIFIDGRLIDEISAYELERVGETCVDRFAYKLLKKYKVDMFVCRVKEVKDYILKGKAKGTLIKG